MVNDDGETTGLCVFVLTTRALKLDLKRCWSLAGGGGRRSGQDIHCPNLHMVTNHVRKGLMLSTLRNSLHGHGTVEVETSVLERSI
eukprot:2177177-Pyramimonas_sp.AAC.2